MARKQTIQLDDNLILHQWMLSLFGFSDFTDIEALIGGPQHEGVTEDNVSKFHLALRPLLPQHSVITPDKLLGYDANILRHWATITERRNTFGHRLQIKYFQYLAALFTEIYLDFYFADSDQLQNILNDYLQRINISGIVTDTITPYTSEQLNKLAFWQATGSGKTLIMHVNLLQFFNYQKRYGREGDINRIILLTPNEGLSYQHLAELNLSNISAELFRKDARSLFAGQMLEIIDIHKLSDSMGDKTVAIEAFENNNLVFVDEGHRGTSGYEWKSKRDYLCERGFSFEYSATFGQAIKAAKNPELLQEYAKCIIMDYSYKYFYRDGYGKDYHILNLENDGSAEIRDLYLTACLLMYYQQLRLYQDNLSRLQPYMIERPLWVLVGSRVNAVYTVNKRKVSDVIDVVLFIASIVQDRKKAENNIQKLLQGSTELRDSSGNEIFANSFVHLTNMTASSIYDDILATVFHSNGSGALHIDDLKDIDGEIGLSVGEREYFGVINVGDSDTLRKLFEEQHGIVVGQREFGKSLFDNVNAENSNINLLIGSKKFTEGWNSWRVSTMGLLNVGQGEGSEIIQLFGRGVRLKGYDFSLKRSRHVAGITPPESVRMLETLNIFGVRADYMHQFKEYLEAEGLPANEQREEFILPVIRNLGQKKLRIVRVKSGMNFKRDGSKPILGQPPAQLLQHPVVLDWYPKIQSTMSKDVETQSGGGKKYEARLLPEHLAFIDIDAIYFGLLQFKNERGWHNLNIKRETIIQLLDPSSGVHWYRLYIPAAELEFRRFEQVQTWQEIASALLKKYVDKYYKYCRSEFESPYLEYQDLSSDDPNFINEYRFLVEQSQAVIIKQLRQLQQQIASGQLQDISVASLFQAIKFSNHLYEPLVYLKSKFIDVTPVALNEGERDFVVHLRNLVEKDKAYFQDKEIYLLRNLSRGKGIGFFDAGNFYPDFILWLLVGDKQYVTFIDPKGIRNLRGFSDEKIQFYKTIKQLEDRLGDKFVILNSFIVSNTPYEQVSWWDTQATSADFEAQNVIFQTIDGMYIRRILDKILE